MTARQPIDWKVLAERGCYVYAYLRQYSSRNGKAGTPYYIGIAKTARRPFAKDHSVGLPACPSLYVVLKSALTIENARAYEQFYIDHYGRIDMGTGCLRNQTPGGERFANAPQVREKAQRTREETMRRREEREAKELGITVNELRSQKKAKHQHASEVNRVAERKLYGMTFRGHSLWVKNGRPSGDLSLYQNPIIPDRTKSEEHKTKLSVATTSFYEEQAKEQGFASLEERKKYNARMKRQRLMDAARALGMTKREYQKHQKALKSENA